MYFEVFNWIHLSLGMVKAAWPVSGFASLHHHTPPTVLHRVFQIAIQESIPLPPPKILAFIHVKNIEL